MAATMRTSKNNFVAHYDDPAINKDAIYIACVRKAGSLYEVVGKWGRRGGHVSQQVKETLASETSALMAAQSLFSTKTRKGYVDITSPGYKGPVSFENVKQHLEPDLDGNGMERLGEDLRRGSARPKKKDSETEFEVVCLDNTGLKWFDEGEQYIAKHDPADDSMLMVFDLLPEGKWHRCLATRFEEVQ